ncbi:MAG TPA: DUF4430 domain-containing protein [Acholeplasmataceae bacterium]|jgi:hypothetical protein|nr:DUF4430 domain-containing protein [Acholeplasmataceae bacterium]
MKKNILKAIITVCSIIVIGLIVHFVNNNKLDNSGTVRIIVIDEAQNEVINEEIYFHNQNLRAILEENFEIEDRNGFLIRINEVYADGNEYFIKIYVNDKAALQGINQLKLSDGDVIKFVYTKVGDYSVPS